eukprot:392938_1
MPVCNTSIQQMMYYFVCFTTVLLILTPRSSYRKQYESIVIYSAEKGVDGAGLEFETGNHNMSHMKSVINPRKYRSSERNRGVTLVPLFGFQHKLSYIGIILSLFNGYEVSGQGDWIRQTSPPFPNKSSSNLIWLLGVISNPILYDPIICRNNRFLLFFAHIVLGVISNPTDDPTDIPTGEPTWVYPTTDPTKALSCPGCSPSINPTQPPSLAPNIAPTLVPSISPTSPPSIAPSSPPSISPTLAPSQSPTACIDYSQHYNSTDGKDKIKTIKFKKNFLLGNQSFDSNVKRYIADIDNYFYDEEINCTGVAVDICLIGCYNPGFCAEMRVNPVSNIKLSELRLICAARKSCRHFSMDIVADTNIASVTIICASSLSCDNSDISIVGHGAIKLSILCIESKSCQNMNVSLMNTDNIAPINVTVWCYDAYSCDGLLIDTDNSPGIFISLNVYQYSEDIFIDYYHYKNVNVQCSFEDKRYIRYDTNVLLDASELLQTSRSEYKTTQRLPCEDITIVCSNNSHFHQECTYQYSLANNFSLVNLLNNKNKPDCYWLEIGQLYQAHCEGTCGDKIIYYHYNQTINLDLIFDHDLENDNNISYRKCNEYFGTNNDTEDSLSSIDAVFESVLYTIISFSSNDFILHDIITPPMTLLSDGKTFIECTKKQRNIIKITTNLTIETRIQNENRITEIFDESSPFVNTSATLLSKLFGIPIKLNSLEKISLSQLGVKNWIVIVIIAGSLAIIISIILLIVWYDRNQKGKLEALTIYIRNPMIIALGIADYEENPTKPQIDGYFPDLNGLEIDIYNIRNLFQDILNYDVFPRFKGFPKLQWTRKEFMNLLETQATILDKNVAIFDENQNKTGGIYDGLVVFISCHGIKDYIATSDYIKVNKTAIHRLFTNNRPNIRKIPRIFVFDCCDGEEEREDGFRTDTIYQKTLENDEILTKEPNENIELQSVSKNIELDSACKNVELKTVSKNVELKTVSDVPSWLRGEDNPDFQLVTVHAANEGFQSKMNSETGSYVIAGLIQKLTKNITQNNNEKFLFRILDEIQEELHSGSKQHTVNTFNDGTRYIKFMTSTSGTLYEENNEIELMELLDKNEVDANIDVDKSNEIIDDGQLVGKQ